MTPPAAWTARAGQCGEPAGKIYAFQARRFSSLTQIKPAVLPTLFLLPQAAAALLGNGKVSLHSNVVQYISGMALLCSKKLKAILFFVRLKLRNLVGRPQPSN